MELGKSKDPRALDGLTLLAQQPLHPAFTFAIAALGKLGDARAFETILLQLNSKDPYRRGIAAAALGDLGDARAVEPLRKLATDSATAWQEDRGPDLSVGEIAKQALKKLGADPPSDGKHPWWKVW